ncbi:spermine/spermidine N-acetyltransferase [Pontibacter ummariensis]|uniref:Spermine/spermidine N-acetyltransferase n=1 Tax=Pontibacter ummariensis TaxID=1610492 RepID=A0A239D7M2_9BACT|nr:GNAT family N-acetyltransferase [Pontibacter ummariensis]PRY14271.1 spermine/spermidine N-acetyltransferase [Pontibacter ummariensis]SNS27874.1 spermine/spermidine N-acetyltransferase [Pontibacter ummariensis]
MNNTRITPCTLEDIHTLQDIAINSYGDHYLYLWYDGGMWYIDKSFSEASLKKELEDPNAAFFLIYSDEELVGFLKLNIDKALEGEEVADSLELERIYLTKAASGKGIGRQVVDFTVAFAKERNKRMIWLKAMDSSKSVDFYEQNGFQKCGTYRLDFEAMKPEYRGMYVLKREL